MKEKTITVSHEVSPEYGKCSFGGDFWGEEVCKYHALRTQAHGNKEPPEYRKPKCLLFNCWLEEPYKKCEACRKACREERKVKAVLISIKPKWCDLIRRGRKTVEIRKTCPKLEVPFKVYIYETMDGGRGSGLVFGEFVCTGFDVFRPIGKGISIKRFPALYESCLTLDEIVKYAQGEPVYGWQISQLKLYEEPFKLEDFSRHGFCGMNGTGVCGNADCENYQPSDNYMEPPTCAINGCTLYEAPQSWCYVEEMGCSE